MGELVLIPLKAGQDGAGSQESTQVEQVLIPLKAGQGRAEPKLGNLLKAKGNLASAPSKTAAAAPDGRLRVTGL